MEAPYLAGISNSFPSSCNMLGPVLSDVIVFFLETFTKKVMGASARGLRAEALRAARIPLSRATCGSGGSGPHACRTL